MGLRGKRQAFVDEFVGRCNFNGTKAAINAGYSEHTARSIASELLTKPDIQAEIEYRLKEKQLSADQVLTRLSEMALGNISDFAHVESQSDLTNLENGYLIKKFKKRYYRKDDYEEVELELYDSQSPLINLGKHLGLFNDKHVLEVKLEKELDGILAVLEEVLPPDVLSNVLNRLGDQTTGTREISETQEE